VVYRSRGNPPPPPPGFYANRVLHPDTLLN
jgi:hypothetical protein